MTEKKQHRRGRANSDTPVGVTSPNFDNKARAERLREAVRSAGGNIEIARKTGIARTTIDGYLAGGEMKFSNALSLAAATGVRLEWLATGEGPVRVGVASELSVLSPDAEPREAPWPPPGYVAFPRLEARAAAGANGSIPSDRLVDYLLFSEDFVRSALRRRREALALIEATGDSMEPTIRDGELLLVDTDATGIQSGRVYVIAVDEDLLVKRVIKRVDGSLLIKSDNPAYDPEVMRPGTNEPARIVGQVIWQGGPVRG